MAVNVPGTSPLAYALQSLGVSRPVPEQKPDPKTAFEGLSRETNVPANVLIALDEAEGGAGDLDKARRYAAFLGEKLEAGAKIEDAVAELVGDAERGATLMNRSYDIADELYPEPAEPEQKPGIGTDLKDLGKLSLAGAINMTGGSLQSLGAFTDDALRQGARAEIEAAGGDPSAIDGESIVRSGSRVAADAVRGVGDEVSGSISDRMKQAMEGTQFDGELLRPSTWTAGDDPSVRGVLGHTAQGLGSMIPVAAASAVAGPAGAAVMGGLGAAGEGAESGREFVEAAQGREGEAGPAAIEAMPGYRALREQGLSHEDAAAELARLTESEAGAWQAIPGTLGGAATGKVLSRAEGFLNAGSRAARVTKKGVAGALEEGTQEAVEGMASQRGIEQATGTDLNTQEGSFGNFVLGALAGGTMGAGSGLIGSDETGNGQPDGAAIGGVDSAIPLLPAPESGGTIFGQSESRQMAGSFERDPSNPNRPAADQSGAGAQFRPAGPIPGSVPDPSAEASRIFAASDQSEIEGEYTEVSPAVPDWLDVPAEGRAQNTSPDGSGAGAVAAPGGEASLSVPPGAAATNPEFANNRILPPQAGPVEAIAQGIAARTPAPAPEIQPMFPEHKPGSAIRLGDPTTGEIVDGVFMGETPEGNAQVRVKGQTLDLTPQEFDALRDMAPQIEAEQKRAEAEAKTESRRAPDAQPGSSDLAQRAQQAARAAGPAPDPVEEPLVEDGDEARARRLRNRLEYLQRQARSTGWNRRLTEEREAAQTALQQIEARLSPAARETAKPEDTGHVKSSLSIEPIRQKAAILRGWDRPEPPAVPGVSLKLDERAGGWIFSRKHEAKVRKALTSPPLGQDQTQQTQGEMTLTGSNDGQQSTTPEHDHRAALADAARQRDAAFDAWEAAGLPGSGPEFDAKDSAIANMAQVRAAANRDLGEKAADRLHAAADDATAQPTVSAFDEAAADAHPEPTDAQKEAGNYKKGHARWNGLDLSIENAKGSERRGTGPDGVEWSVTMPAHYGYFRGTEGADGDHVDFYMGDDPDVQHAYVIDQVDADTGAYDEAKVMLGYDAPQDARDAHSAAFSDGKGAARRGGMMKLTIPELKEWLASDKTKQPISRQAKAAERKRAQAPSAAAVQTTAPTTGILSSLSQEKQDRAADLKARLAAKVRNQASSGLDPEYITLGAELVALYIEGGARKFGEMLRDFAASTGLSIREAQAPMRAAYTHVRDDMDLNGEDISGMDDHASVMAEVRRAMAEESTQTPATQEQVQAPQVPATLQENAAPEAENDNRTDASDGGTRAQEGEADSGSRQGQAGSLRSSDRDAGRAGDRSAERARERSEPNTDGSGSGDGPRSRSRTGDAGAVNHVIEPGGLDLARGEKTRARESIAAIRVLRTIQQEGRPATADERVTLAKYGGAGTLAGTLPRSDGTIKHPDLAAEIEALTTPEERATLSRTSQYAFYTAESALRSMWKLAQQLGFTGGRVYEPGMGVGGFAGTMPGGVKATYTGLELDHLTAQIAQALYPRHAVKHGDFIKQKLPQGFYDLVIGNPPFAGTQIKADADYPQGFMIHDYFFAKSLDSVRPGGLLMFITSAGTMNKMDSKARDYLADRADLVGAIRLPNTAFKENGTEVTTDIIVLRKRTEGEAEADPAWRRSEVVDLPREDGATGQAAVNSYFVRHPEMILGDQGLYDTLTASDRVGVRPRKGSDLRTDLQAALAHFPTGIMSDAPASVQMDALDADHAETKAGSFYLKDGVLHQFDGNTGRPVEVRSKANAKGMPKAAMEAIKALIPIKNALRDVYSADVDGRDATAARRALNRAYDAYVKERGPIGLQQRREQRPSVVEMESARQQAENDARAAGEPFDIGSFDAGLMIEAGASMAEVARARKEARELTGYEEGSFDPEAMPNKMLVSRPNIDPFMDDPESYRLLAIERYDEKTDTATKTRVFTENAVKITARPQINSPEDALLHLLGETGSVDPARIAALANSTPERVIKELEGKIFQNPTTREWETKAKYLSGNVIQKLEEAEREARANPEYQPNVDALREVQPAPVAAADIAVPLGAHWFPARIYSDFAKSLGLDLKAEFKPRLGIWLVDGSKTGSAATTEWGTPDRPFGELMGLAMSNKKIEVRRSRRHPDGTTETWVDEEATQAANDKARELQDKFKEWFWSDESRTAEMERIYNRTFNAEVAPKYDGGYLTTPGIHSDWSWRPHQTSVIARILQSGDTYMAHTVGAGKTSAMIGAGMEAKRLGLAKKPWYSVPNHMLIQFATEFYQQYPLAKVLVADDRRFHTSRRKQFVADAALGDYDAVIITHSAFQLIPASEASKKAAVEGMLQDVRDVLEGLKGGSWGEDAGMERSVLGALNSMAATLGVNVRGVTEGKTKTRKKIEALLEAAEQRISRQTSDKGKDAVFDFDETGADLLFVDEAHLFRKLSFATSMGSIKGIDPEGSQQSMDLFIKTRALAQRNPGRSLVLASGTPITNTMAELYSISRYLQPQALEDRNITAFDSWAATFGTTESALEQAPDGGYKLVTRFAKFVNTPELSLMARQVMDVVSSKDLEQYVTRPALKGGKRNLVVVEPSPELKAYQQDLGARMRLIEKRKGPVKKGDDILLSVINDGRLAAIDMRLVDPSASENGSKLDRMIQNVYRTWRNGADAPLHGVKPEGGYTDAPVMRGPTTQIVFSTLGVNPTKHNPTFSVHRFIKAQLVSMGVPAEDIILAENLTTDARKQRAFNDMNEGKKRILIGSKTLFTGVNAQRRLAAIHNLDPLWFPADDEQRNGRGIRQGNMNPEIAINDYSAKGTYDATMWQMMARKASFIEGFFRGDPDIRDMDDLGEASQYEQAKAMSTADPRVLELTELRAERDKLLRRAGAATRTRQQMEAKLRSLRRNIELDREEQAYWKKQAARVQDTGGDAFTANMGGKTYTDRKDFGADLIVAAEDALAGEGFKMGDRVGTISGLPIHIWISKASGEVAFDIRLAGDKEVSAGFSADPVGMARKVEHALAKIKGTPDRIESEIQRRERELTDTEEGLGKLKGFTDQEQLDALSDQVAALEDALLSENALPEGDEKNQRDMSEPVAVLTGDELGEWSDIRQLGKKATAWYRINLTPEGEPVTVTNTETGWTIKFNKKGASKIGGRKGEDLYRAVVALPDILRHGKLVETEADSKERPDIKAVHKMVAKVRIAGRDMNLIATIRETRDGKFHYDLSKDRADGGEGRSETALRHGDAKLRSSALEGALAELNLDFADPKINAAVSTSALRGLADSVSSILRQHGLAGKVSPKVLRGLLSASGVHVLGSYRAGGINVSASAADPAHVTRHEIIHALRDSSLWGRDHGLFTADEWRALVGAARRDAAIRSRVEEAYADQDTITQSEEMVAEFYADWAQSGRAAPAGPLGRALERIRSFFRAIASALRGEGFHDAAAIMERIADGEIGGRGPDGPGSGGRGSNQEKYNHDGDFVRAPNGSFSFGEISPEIATALGRQAGVIRLRRGDENCGLIHIERRHGDDIRRMGFTSIEDFVQVVARDFTAVYGRPGRALDLVLDGGERGMLIVQLEPHPSGDFYDIRTATPIRSGQYQRKEPLWERTGPRASSAVADPLNPKGQSGSINIGRVSDSGKDSEEKNQRDMSAIKAQLSRSKGRALGMIGNLHWKNAPGYFSSLLTDAMGRNDRFNLLSLVPGHPLFEELGKGMPAAQKYLREKQTMDAWRNDWQARGAAVVDGWTKQARKNPEANDRLMDLMHASTLAGIDPSKAGSWHQPVDDEARRTLKQPNLSAAKREWAHRMLRDANDRERTWQRLRADFDALPAEFRDLYQQIRDEYAAMADEQDAALMANIRTASKIALKRADREHRKELQRIRDEGLTGEARAEALEKANKRKTEAHARAARGGGARLQQLRQMFESNKLAGPYFPLTRFGNYFVTIRDEDGKVTSFSRFQTEREQRAWMQTATDRSLGKIEHGVLGGDANLKGKVDPTFVAEVESLLAEAGASDEMMDAVWQRWLETLPDQSVRTNRIHRKGRLGFNKDAMRAFSSAMFHGAHQTARLRHGLEMEDALDDAEEQAKHDPNPNRAGFVVREMRQRHAFTMSPTNNPLVSSASGLAFIWYLGMSPAAAIVNLSQTSIVGIPLLATRFKRAGVSGTAAELGRALRDFGAGRGWVERSDRLTTDEKAAMKAGYDRGVIDKTQSHDLAAVAESGVEYNPTREKVMRVIGFMFHHAERLNREVTFLAAYRMARAESVGHAEAVDEASRQVWKVHFDYQNTSRPRVMQSDMGKILTTFRNFTVNMIYRLFRDTHQAFAGADAETRREARAQLIGISLSMFAHAGIKGVWGFGILSMLLGALLPGDDDDFENWLQDALLIEGDGAGVAAWNWTMAMALNGVPGTVLDMNLTNRIGMPDLWFRSPQKDLEGKDLWSYYVEQVAGPVAGIGGSVLTGASMLADGQWQRGSEKMVPKFGGDLIKTARYAGDGVTTYHGDPILDRVNPYQALTTALGFTPAEISERYRANSWLKNQEAKIEGERKSIMGDIARSIKSGDGVTPDLATRVREWNVKYPFYPITAQGMRQSIASRQRMSQRTQGGVNLNPKLDRYLREQVAPAAH